MDNIVDYILNNNISIKNIKELSYLLISSNIYYKDLLYYRNDPIELQNLKNRILDSKKRKKKVELQPLNHFQLISDDEDN